MACGSTPLGSREHAHACTPSCSYIAEQCRAQVQEPSSTVPGSWVVPPTHMLSNSLNAYLTTRGSKRACSSVHVGQPHLRRGRPRARARLRVCSRRAVPGQDEGGVAAAHGYVSQGRAGGVARVRGIGHRMLAQHVAVPVSCACAPRRTWLGCSASAEMVTPCRTGRWP